MDLLLSLLPMAFLSFLKHRRHAQDLLFLVFALPRKDPTRYTELIYQLSCESPLTRNLFPCWASCLLPLLSFFLHSTYHPSDMKYTLSFFLFLSALEWEIWGSFRLSFPAILPMSRTCDMFHLGTFWRLFYCSCYILGLEF